MKTFTKKYQVWTQSLDGLSWGFNEFDTLQEALMAPKNSEFYITKRVNLNVNDAEEVTIPHARPNVTTTQSPQPAEPSEPDPAEELAAKYAGGPVGAISEG